MSVRPVQLVAAIRPGSRPRPPTAPGPRATADRARADAPPAAHAYLAFGAALALALFIFGTVPLQPALWRAAGRASPFGIGFACLTALVGLRWCLFFTLAFLAYERDRRRRQTHATPPDGTDLPPVSILVPAYNEERTIEPALRSLLTIDYPRCEIIVVDDGSTDATFAQALPFAAAEHGPRTVRVYRKPNGGKWSALNYAFHRSTHELLLCVDADSRLEPPALRRLVARMADPRVTGVAGQVRVRNRVNLLTRLQGLEYVIANGLVRLAQSLTGTVLVVPGPVGLFRRSALEEAYLRFGSRGPEAGMAGTGAAAPDGPFEGDTFAEDFDLSLALLSLGGTCVYEPLAVSQTKAPDWTFSLISQRYRWCRGTIQVLRKYWRRCRFHADLRRPRVLAWLGITYALELIVLPVVNLTAILLACGHLAAGGTLVPLLGWAAAFMLLNLNAAAFFVASHNESPWALAMLPFYDLYHGFLLNSGLVIAVLDELRGRAMRW